MELTVVEKPTPQKEALSVVRAFFSELRTLRPFEARTASSILPREKLKSMLNDVEAGRLERLHIGDQDELFGFLRELVRLNTPYSQTGKIIYKIARILHPDDVMSLHRGAVGMGADLNFATWLGTCDALSSIKSLSPEALDALAHLSADKKWIGFLRSEDAMRILENIRRKARTRIATIQSENGLNEDLVRFAASDSKEALVWFSDAITAKLTERREMDLYPHSIDPKLLNTIIEKLVRIRGSTGSKKVHYLVDETLARMTLVFKESARKTIRDAVRAIQLKDTHKDDPLAGLARLEEN